MSSGLSAAAKGQTQQCARLPLSCVSSLERVRPLSQSTCDHSQRPNERADLQTALASSQRSSPTPARRPRGPTQSHQSRGGSPESQAARRRMGRPAVSSWGWARTAAHTPRISHAQRALNACACMAAQLLTLRRGVGLGGRGSRSGQTAPAVCACTHRVGTPTATQLCVRCVNPRSAAAPRQVRAAVRSQDGRDRPLWSEPPWQSRS